MSPDLSQRTRLRLARTALALLSLAGCGPTPAAVDASVNDAGVIDAAPAVDAATVVDAGPWTDCGPFSCRTVDVPIDDVDPANGTIPLRVVRASARRPEARIGTLLFMSGGPGVSGVDEASNRWLSIATFMPEVADRFDIVFWDRRGTDTTTPIACIDAQWLDDYRSTPVDPVTAEDWAAVDAIWQRYADGCIASPPPYSMAMLSTDTAARDADRIRAALGEETISVLGVSYGGLTAAIYTTLFPSRVRAGVLDSPPAPMGPTYPQLALYEQLATEGEAILDAFFAWCDDPASACVFPHPGTTSAAAYDALAATLTETPIVMGDRSATAFDLVGAVWWEIVIGGGDPDAFHAPLAALLRDAALGMGADLLAGNDDWFVGHDHVYDMTFNNAWLGTLLADAPCPAGFDLADAETAWTAIRTRSPRIGPLMFNNTLSCLNWPTPRAAPFEIASGDSPLLVLGGMHDLGVGPEGPVAMHEALGLSAERLVRFEGYGHVVGLGDSCMGASASAFLIDPAIWVAPPGGACAP